MIHVVVPSLVVGYFIGRARAARSRPSHMPGVPQDAWEKYVAASRVQGTGDTSPKGRLGAFAMDPRRLEDMGLVVSARKTKDGSGAWECEWADGLTGDDFLGNLPLQYATFVRSTKAMAPKVSRHVGTVVDGQKCSLSGLLGVGHVAGEGAVDGWVDGAKRFPATTLKFKATNGIF